METDIQIQQLKVSGDIPSSRFGHTFTMISKTRAVLFGGAIGDSGKFIITNETFLFDFQTKKWKKIEAQGQAPSQRAAHCSCQIENNQMVIFGGAASGGGGLSSDDLFLLDLKNTTETWVIIPVQGQTPGKRYGHTMVFFKPFLIVFGGNTGTLPINDTWILNVEKAPYQWTNYQFESEVPCVRVYHAANLCQNGSANGMMVIFGGRTSDQSALNDTWGLRRHRDGKWDWIQAPYKQNTEPPICRYQHWISFIGPLMIVMGGRSNSSELDASMVEIYDTESSDWHKFKAINRYRHTILSIDNYLYVHGGFEPEFPNKPLDTMLQLDIEYIGRMNPKLAKILARETNNQNVLQESNNNSLTVKLQNNSQRSITPVKQSKGQLQCQNKNIRISNQAVVAMTYNPEDDTSGIIKRVPIQKLAEESKKIGNGYCDQQNPINNFEQICQMVIQSLIKSKDWKPNELRVPFKKDLISRLCDEMQIITEQQPNVVKLRVPVKIFGSIFGRFNEMIRYFESFGFPHDEDETGDIENFDYLFLGNYVDRGFNGLEVICLLFALKIKFPDHIHLIRGRHEDIRVNKLFGFAEECAIRLGEDINDPNSIFQKINKVFSCLPLAAVIEDRIICVHGGVGKNITNFEQLENIDRSLNIWDKNNNITQELLWSEYNNIPEGQVVENKQKDLFQTGQVTKFGEAKLRNFLNDNEFSMMITSSECINEGFERNQYGTWLNIFSVPDYGGKYQNNGSMLKIKKNFEMIPCVLEATNIKVGTWINQDTNLKSSIRYNEEENKLRKRQLTPPKQKNNFKIL